MILLGELDVSYGQVAIFQSRLPDPFNDWQDAHVRQGFSWRPGSVSFRTLDDGSLKVEVGQGTPPIEADAVRVIRVPFTVDESGEVEVATISQAKLLELKPGTYSLTFEHGRMQQGQMWCRLYWEKVQAQVSAKVLRADPELAPEEVLLMEAQPATSS
jgi:Competence protein J (ComJ)